MEQERQTTNTSKPVEVYLEIGKKRVLAGALEWPGWCRGGRDAGAAVGTLLEYAPRYRLVLEDAGLDFPGSLDVSAFEVVERLPGSSTTDFGAPDVAPSADAIPLDAAELERQRAILQACWHAFDAAVREAEGKELRKGPRGGGREVVSIVEHVLGAEQSYVARLGGKLPHLSEADIAHYLSASHPVLDERRQMVLDALGAAAGGEFPAQGPRGGARWSPRYFVRRTAWHILDHAWEIEDRAS